MAGGGCAGACASASPSRETHQRACCAEIAAVVTIVLLEASQLLRQAEAGRTS